MSPYHITHQQARDLGGWRLAEPVFAGFPPRVCGQGQVRGGLEGNVSIDANLWWNNCQYLTRAQPRDTYFC